MREALYNICLYVNSTAFVSSLMMIVKLPLRKAQNDRLLRISIFYFQLMLWIVSSWCFLIFDIGYMKVSVVVLFQICRAARSVDL